MTYVVTFLPPKKKMSDFVLEVVADDRETAKREARKDADMMGFRDYRLSNIRERSS